MKVEKKICKGEKMRMRLGKMEENDHTNQSFEGELWLRSLLCSYKQDSFLVPLLFREREGERELWT